MVAEEAELQFKQAVGDHSNGCHVRPGLHRRRTVPRRESKTGCGTEYRTDPRTILVFLGPLLKRAAFFKE